MEVHSFHSEGLCLMLALIKRRIGRMLYRANTKRQRKAVAVQKILDQMGGKNKKSHSSENSAHQKSHYSRRKRFQEHLHGSYPAVQV
jgi:hypothetical protein